MKSILISIQPQWVEKILNGEKTIEIRKTMPKCELPCKVYIYCTNGNMLYDLSKCGVNDLEQKVKEKKNKRFVLSGLKSNNITKSSVAFANRKIVAEFTLKNIVKFDIENLIFMGKEQELMQKSCMGGLSLRKYLGNKIGYSWGINDLKIYNKPLSLINFGIIKPPQSWCYVEEYNNGKHWV